MIKIETSQEWFDKHYNEYEKYMFNEIDKFIEKRQSILGESYEKSQEEALADILWEIEDYPDTVYERIFESVVDYLIERPYTEEQKIHLRKKRQFYEKETWENNADVLKNNFTPLQMQRICKKFAAISVKRNNPYKQKQVNTDTTIPISQQSVMNNNDINIANKDIIANITKKRLHSVVQKKKFNDNEGYK